MALGDGLGSQKNKTCEKEVPALILLLTLVEPVQVFSLHNLTQKPKPSSKESVSPPRGRAESLGGELRALHRLCRLADFFGENLIDDCKPHRIRG